MYTWQSRIGAYTPFERHTASRKKNDARARLHACFCRKTGARGAPSSLIERLERTEPLQNSRPSHGRFHQISKIKTSTNSISRLLLNNCYNFLTICFKKTFAKPQTYLIFFKCACLIYHQEGYRRITRGTYMETDNQSLIFFFGAADE